MIFVRLGSLQAVAHQTLLARSSAIYNAGLQLGSP